MVDFSRLESSELEMILDSVEGIVVEKILERNLKEESY